MPNIVDANLLLALLDDEHDHSAAARKWFNEIDGFGSVGVMRATQIAVLRLLNNPVVMSKANVCTGREAWNLVDRFMQDDRVTLLGEPPHLENHLRQTTSGLKYSPKVWPDAYLAAFAMASGRKLVTFDKGFRAYAGLDVEILGSGARG